MAASKTAMTTARDSSDAENEGLPTLVGRLGDDVMQLFDTKLSLLKVEIKEEVNAYISGALAIALGGIVAAVGFALLNVAVAFGVSTFFAGSNMSQSTQYALGFVITGLFYLLIGGIVVLVTKNRLAKQDLVPAKTVEELRKDKQWLKNEL